MTNYLITHKKTKATLLFTYDLKGFLIAFKCNFSMDEAKVKYIKKTLPMRVAEVTNYKADGFLVQELKQDISFNAFWNAYAHKVGNKSRAEKLWNALTDIEKAKALNYISVYNNFLIENQGIQRLYPETYLSQKRFNNE